MSTTYKYRRFASQDFSAWSLVEALDSSICSAWRAMQQDRRAARQARAIEPQTPGLQYLYESHRRMAFTYSTILRELFYLRREGRS